MEQSWWTYLTIIFIESEILYKIEFSNVINDETIAVYYCVCDFNTNY